MIWMRSDKDFSSLIGRYFQGHLAAWICWVLLGVGVLAGASALGLEAWVLVATAMVWLGLGVLWLQHDAVQPEATVSQARNDARSVLPIEALPVWSEWISGWYWQTDADHRLHLLKPGMGLDQSSTNWAGAHQWATEKPNWFDCWRFCENSPCASAFGRLQFAMQHRQPLADAVELQLPSQLGGAQLSGSEGQGLARLCLVKAQPRWTHDGVFAGFHGVIEPQAAPVVITTLVQPVASVDVVGELAAAPIDEAVGNGVVPTPMTESDQEVLRYALSHDLRAPLRVVDGFTRIVKEDYAKVLDRMGMDHLDRVLSAAARMNGMIDAILAQAQLAGAALQRERIDLTALCLDIVSEMGGMAGGAGSARFDIAPELSVEADPILVRRVLENLLSNALKYSAKVESPLIEVGVMPATNPAVFFVRDNGAGFDMQRADKLFGLFQRMHSAKEFPGTGVGLAGVHNIIRRHGGQVWAEASPGKGACFYFTLMGTAEAQQRAARQA